MEEKKYSAVLERIIENAKGGEGKTSMLTSESFVLASLALLGSAANEPELKPLAARLGDSEQARLDYEQKLKSSIENNSVGFLAGVAIQNKLMTLMKRASESGDGVLRADAVLESIFTDPAEKAAKLLPGAEQAKKEGEEKPTDELMRAIEKFYRQSGGSAPEDKEREEEPVGDPRERLAELTKKAKDLQGRLLDVVYGQDNAVSTFASGYFQAELMSMTDKNRVKPKATFLFAGPPGVGKTFLAEQAAQALGLPFMRFDMSEYSDKEANIEFAGSDKVYKNGKEGNVTGFVAANPKCVLLFDEVEKANLVVIHLFLQLLDAGRLRDNYTDKEVPFKDAIIFFTTNAGRSLYEDAESGDLSGFSRKVVLNALRRDINPITGSPFFPAALCSRFASGNVVMFNHIEAHDLKEIAKREIRRQAGNFAREIGTEVEIDETVYSALLFAEGGAADARTIKSRAETFFNDEVFELLRLVSAERTEATVEGLEKIKIDIELPAGDPELMAYFKPEDKQELMIFASPEVADECVRLDPGRDYIRAASVKEAAPLLDRRDISTILIDMSHGRRGTTDGRLNTEDIESEARDMFWHIHETHRDIPVYLLEKKGEELGAEERISFTRQGARGVIELSEDYGARIGEICDRLHQQKSMIELARANKLISFETAQFLAAGAREAEIRLFDFELSTAVDSEDARSVLSDMSRPDTRFDHVIGAEDAKKELKYFVEYLKNPRRYLSTGVGAPKGVLLYGPPGTGKTMLARAMAGESNVTFITAEGNQFLKKYVGEGPEKVHELFRTARKYAPSILFVDEIDAIAKERRGGDNTVASEETLTAFLAEMDGFKNDISKPVFVLAATNFEVTPGTERSLDQALMRRFDRRVYIDLPDRDDRIRYIRMKMGQNAIFELSDEKLDNIAVRSTGMSLAQLESVFELALRSAIRDGGLKVTDEVFEEAFETFNSGEAKKWDDALLERVARHEAGHAFLCWESGEKPSYVTVVARADHGGYMQHADEEGKAIYTKDELLAKIRTSLGGRAAELVYYGDKDGLSTGASGDLISATRMARRIVCSYGMDEQFGLAVTDGRDSAEAAEIRAAVNRLLSRELEKAVELISQNRAAIDVLVAKLIDRNHLTGDEIDEAFKNTVTQS